MIFSSDIKWTYTFGNMPDVNVMGIVLDVLPYPLSHLEMPFRHNLADVDVVLLQKSDCSDETLFFHVTIALDLIAL